MSPLPPGEVLKAVTTALNLTDTVVQTVRSYRNDADDLSFTLLIEQVRVETLKGLDEADRTLRDFERVLDDSGINMDMTLEDVIGLTPWWRPDQAYRLKRMRSTFNNLADAAYDASDDIAALARCRNYAGLTHAPAREHLDSARAFQQQLQDTTSLRGQIDLLRTKLDNYKATLG
jgi:hypothetical protein